ncbi:hypothetical protein ANANG_G00135910, partial [Anguilla anguilla]
MSETALGPAHHGGHAEAVQRPLSSGGLSAGQPALWGPYQGDGGPAGPLPVHGGARTQ